ncbi:U3 small nucleolar RNA-associated protein 14-like B [Exaiptasia diaphana]|nr:U3 small nucleolar RNA-associated protein 14-like B [Exaiptasia diaphana]
MMERKNKELTEEEEQALLTMSVEEAKERRKELQRLRALQSYYEEKCRRAKKIKSKKYHRIKKKGEKRSAEKHLEDLEKTDPEKALEELEKLERERAKERLSLKHRSTSKWAKNLLIRGQNNPEAKKALQEQLDLSRKLTEKQREMSESEEEEESGVLPEDDDESNTFGRLVAEADNPWSIDKTGDVTALDDNEKKTNELSGFKLAEPIINKESVYIDNNNENSDTEAPEDDFEITLSKNTKPTKSTKKKRKQKTSNEVHESEISKTNEKAKKGKDKIKKKTKKKKHEGNDEENDETEFHEIEGNNQNLGDNSTPNKTATAESAKSAKPKKSAKPTSSILDPKKIFPHEDGNLQSDDADQLMTIQQAFANDDVIEEFVREKEDAVELSKGKDLDLTLPGWGEWGGPGVKVSVKKKNKFVKKAEEKSSRKDKDLAHVIINEEVNKKFAKIQVSKIH